MREKIIENGSYTKVSKIKISLTLKVAGILIYIFSFIFAMCSTRLNIHICYIYCPFSYFSINTKFLILKLVHRWENWCITCISNEMFTSYFYHTSLTPVEATFCFIRKHFRSLLKNYETLI